MTAEALYRKLADEGIFWSYDKKLDYIGDDLLIEHTLLYAEVSEIKDLFKIFDFAKIKDVWERKVVPDERHYGLNYYLALIWFDISEPKEYLQETAKKYSRYERLKHIK